MIKTLKFNILLNTEITINTNMNTNLKFMEDLLLQMYKSNSIQISAGILILALLNYLFD